MPTGLWRVLALVCAAFSLAVVVADAVDWQQYTDEHIGFAVSSPAPHGYATVITVSGDPLASGGLRVGDSVQPRGRPWSPRDTLSTWPAGTVLTWNVARGARHFHAQTVVSPPAFDDVVFAEIVNAVRFAMLVVAFVLALRRPDAADARALATFLIAFGLAAFTVPAWLPDRVLAALAPLRGVIVFAGIGYATLFACVFPSRAERGVRGVIRRATIPCTLVLCAAFLVLLWLRDSQLVAPATLTPLATGISDASFAFIGVMVLAFALGAAGARGADRPRVLWAAGSVLAGFSGTIVFLVLLLVFHQIPEWTRYLQLSLILTPIGLAYSILRYRTIDIGFVVSRAIVLTTVSVVIVAVFGLLERALGKIFIDASHVASRSVEIALALGLGFSLRSLHARIEQLIDRIFFRRRRLALAELRSFAADVYFITDPDVAIERTVETVARCADAAGVALFLIADGVFGRAAAVDPGSLPSEVGENDPLFVRLRSTRKPERLRELGSALDADIAFPLFVRGTLVGALVLAPKRSSETYDPEETALLADLAQRVALALDALQTIALRRELEALAAVAGRA
jgi:hypothetical protein